MTQRIIDVDGVPTLFSPVLAHTLEPGDLITTSFSDMPVCRVAAAIGADPHLWWSMRQFAVAAPGYPDGTRLELGANATVYRAVGARAGRGGAR